MGQFKINSWGAVVGRYFWFQKYQEKEKSHPFCKSLEKKV